MKKWKIIRLTLLAAFIAFLALPAAIFGQPDSAIVDPDIPIPDGLADLLNYKYWLGGLSEVAGVVLFLTGILLTFVFKSATKRWRQGVALILGVVITLGMDLANVGYMAEAPLLTAGLYGLGSGFLANGWYNIPEVKGILKWLRIKPPSLPA